MFLTFEFPPLLYYIRSGVGLFEPGRVHRTNEHSEYFNILFVFEGTINIKEENNEFVVNQGEFLILESGKKHHGTLPCKIDTLYYWLHFEVSGKYYYSTENYQVLKISDYKNFITLPKTGKIKNTSIVWEQLKNLDNLHSYSDQFLKLQQQVIFQQIIPHLILKKDNYHSNQIKHIAKNVALYLEENFKSQISYSELSNEFNFSSPYLSRCFKKIYSITPLEYLNRIRIEETKFYLRNTDLSIENIAFETGFNSHSYLTRTFAKVVGQNPIEYRFQYQSE